MARLRVRRRADPRAGLGEPGPGRLAVRHRPESASIGFANGKAGRLGLAADLVGRAVRPARGRPRAPARPSTSRPRPTRATSQHTQGADDAHGDAPGRQTRVTGSPVDRHRHDGAGRHRRRRRRRTPTQTSATTVVRRPPAPDGSFSVTVPVTGGTSGAQRRRRSPTAATGARAAHRRLRLRAGHAAARRAATRTATTTGRATTPIRRPATSSRAPSTCSVPGLRRRHRRDLPGADARPDADLRQPARRPAGRRLRARPGAAPTSTAASFPQRNYHDRPGVRLEPADRGAGLRPALRRRRRRHARHGRDLRELDLAVHHVQRPEGDASADARPAAGASPSC